MKKNLKHIVNCLLLVFGGTKITYSQCIADAGENAALCTHWGLDTFYLGGAPTAVGGYVPEYRLTNLELEKMVDTNDEWIRSRTGIEERRILKEEGKGSSDLAAPGD